MREEWLDMAGIRVKDREERRGKPTLKLSEHAVDGAGAAAAAHRDIELVSMYVGHCSEM